MDKQSGGVESGMYDGRRTKKYWSVLFVALALLASRTWCDDKVQDDAQQLRDEATEILKHNATKPVSPNEFAMAIYRLEKAQAILEAAKDNDCPLAQEVCSALFWARKCSNVIIMKELDKIHAANPALKLASQDPKPKTTVEKVDKKADADGLPEVDSQAEIKTAFAAVEEFAKAHQGDDYVISMRYFQFVNEYPGNDYALKAVMLANEAQMRFAVKNGVGPKEELVDGPEAKLIAEGDKLALDKKFEAAIAKYKDSLRAKDTLTGHRKLGHAYYQRAQQRKEEINKEFEDFLPKYQEAYKASFFREGTSKNNPPRFNPLTPIWQAAKKRHGEILAEAEHVWTIYVYGQWEFEKILKMAPEHKDFDAAAYEGITLSARVEDKSKAVAYLSKFLKEYEPANDMQKFVYEYCKTELDRISH